MLIVQLLAGFQSLPTLLTSKLGPSGADSQVGGFVCILGLVGLSNELSCEAGCFSCCCNTHRFLKPEVLRLYFLLQEPWVVWLSRSLVVLPGYPHTNVGPPSPPAAALPCCPLYSFYQSE